MITLLFFTAGITLTGLLVPKEKLWPTSISQTAILSVFTTAIVSNHWSSSWHNLSTVLAADSISAPLIILSCWLAPMALLASKNHLNNSPELNQRAFILLITIITGALIITFSALELVLFYIAFETTLIPTLILIARWGAQMERFQAGIYFIFYTLFGSLPLLISLIALSFSSLSLSIPNVELIWAPDYSLPSLTAWWSLSILAFLVKMPIYGFHLWLPKAHVEAPVAGSMILAAILLKLGGYGLIRLITLFSNTSLNNTSLVLVVFCSWGALITSMICIRQTDLKALIAYSSVGHMSIVAAGVFSETSWGLNGALILMIAHGLVSSALFSLANTIYERSNTRTLAITRGLKLILPLSTIWWLLMCAANLGLPPSPNLIGEILIISSLINWSIWLLPIVGFSTVFGAVYSLMIFQLSQQGAPSPFLNNISLSFSREHLLASLHILPLTFIIFSPTLTLIT
uniref:NADH-ubiquinone oxidoreductase chain 4 n=1 Tax=Glyptocidaris crenularis TaxID=31907 RepID=A0A1L3MYE3_9ECHN|nr:NADH dehydrogenase subunit 4 [Glyptocidaris crenularis]APH07351.1 NADH dehydrogenase subunit 4 [Glyptocidaris crenularis]